MQVSNNKKTIRRINYSEASLTVKNMCKSNKGTIDSSRTNIKIE